jgi:hypothetical protein
MRGGISRGGGHDPNDSTVPLTGLGYFTARETHGFSPISESETIFEIVLPSWPKKWSGSTSSPPLWCTV